MISCPLPIDWLDLLVGRSSNASRAHLDGCAACRAVVASLDDATAVQDPNVTALVHLGKNGRPRPNLIASGGLAQPAAGEIRWLTFAGIPQRLPVLLLEDIDGEIAGCFDIAPLLTDIENATYGDLILAQADTTTNIRWRVAFRLQTIVHQRYLSNIVGTTTASGEVAVSCAKAGVLPFCSTGAALESDNDPRLRIDPCVKNLLDATSVMD